MKKITLPFVVLLLGAGAVHAGTQMKPGLWEITMTMDMPGVVMPPMTRKICLSAADVASGESTIPKDEQSGCTVGSFTRSGDTATWSMTCPDMNGKGRMTYGSDSYNGATELKMQVDGEAMEMKQSYNGKRLGDCQK